MTELVDPVEHLRLQNQLKTLELLFDFTFEDYMSLADECPDAEGYSELRQLAIERIIAKSIPW